MTIKEKGAMLIMGAQEWLAPGIMRLPYIRTYRTKYINLNVSKILTVRADVQFNSDGVILGRYQSNSRYAIRRASPRFIFGFGTGNINADIQSDSDRHIFVINPFNKECSIDDNTYHATYTMRTVSKQITFGVYNSTTFEDRCDSTAYKIEFYESDGSLVYEYTPAYNTDTAEDGFFCIVASLVQASFYRL